MRYDFICRRFLGKMRLVPSNIAKRNRFPILWSNPLNHLPNYSLVAVVNFLSGLDLRQLFLTCSTM